MSDACVLNTSHRIPSNFESSTQSYPIYLAVPRTRINMIPISFMIVLIPIRTLLHVTLDIRRTSYPTPQSAALSSPLSILFWYRDKRPTIVIQRARPSAPLLHPPAHVVVAVIPTPRLRLVLPAVVAVHVVADRGRLAGDPAHGGPGHAATVAAGQDLAEGGEGEESGGGEVEMHGWWG